MIDNTRKQTIVHVINGLNEGGAEAVLFRLISATKDDLSHLVISMLDEGVYGERLRSLGIRVEVLNMQRGSASVSGFVRLRRYLKEMKPSVVQTWMYHANLAGGLAARFSDLSPVIWGIHHCNLDAKQNKALTVSIAKACGILSRWIPNLIVCCSEEAVRVHRKLGYREDKLCVIPNGYDLSSFKPCAEARRTLRQEWKIAEGEAVVGLVARWDSQKDHANLLRALELLTGKGIELRCVLVGPNICTENSDLVTLLKRHGLTERALLMGQRSDISDIMNALDLHVLSSIGESFPNTVAEAMACGTPCVVTDVGDAAVIVGDTGWVVPPSNPTELANAIERALAAVRQEGREIVGSRCRKHIADNFSLERMASAYRAVWQGVNKKRIEGVQ